MRTEKEFQKMKTKGKKNKLKQGKEGDNNRDSNEKLTKINIKRNSSGRRA
jgi:hypothetical protein